MNSEDSLLNMVLFEKTVMKYRGKERIMGKNFNNKDFIWLEKLVEFINLENTNAKLRRQEVFKIERLKKFKWESI